MKYLFYILLCYLLFVGQVFGQNNEVNLEVVNSWEQIGNYEISADGNYLWYTINSRIGGSNLTLTDLKDRKYAEVLGCQGGRFLQGGKYLVCSTSERVSVLETRSFKRTDFAEASNLQIPIHSENQFSYMIANDLHINTLGVDRKYVLKNVIQYWSNDYGSAVIFLKNSILSCFRPGKGPEKTIVTADEFRNINFDNLGQRIAFTCKKSGIGHLIIYDVRDHRILIDIPQSKGKTLATKQGQKLRAVRLPWDLSFSPDGSKLYFRSESSAEVAEPNLLTMNIDVWSYRDKFLVPFQRNMEQGLISALDISSGQIRQLEHDSLRLYYGPRRNKYILMTTLVNDLESYWKPSEVPRIYLLKVDSGEEINFLTPSNNHVGLQLSPDEKYVTWTDTLSGGLFCYDIKHGIIRNMVSGTFAGQGMKKIERFNANSVLQSICWLQNDEGWIVRDKFDLWQLDPSGKKKAICLTAGWGLRNRKVFSLVAQRHDLKIGDSILAAVVDPGTNYNGFCKLKLSKENIPILKLWGPYHYSCPSGVWDFAGREPIKARHGERYIIQRQTDTSRMNLFLTEDFNNLVQVTALKTPRELMSRCINLKWISSSGTPQRGLLYVPIHLDTTKKYPVILNYYRIRSNEQFLFRRPHLSNANINIPWYLSRGYLVFIPDITSVRGKTGVSALETITSGAEYLCNNYGFVDKDRLGLQGHSHGGYLTNFVVTHSNLFAAAQSSAGYSDFFAGYSQMGFGNTLLQNMQEIGANNLGMVPWKAPDVYQANSTLFAIDKVSTPLLMMHNKDDGVVDFSQGQALFAFLRRAGKKVWLLQYDGGGHALPDSDSDGYDFTIRQQQFFDHYLKGRPAPLWMVEGVPNKYKGIKSGLRLDSLERIP